MRRIILLFLALALTAAIASWMGGSLPAESAPGQESRSATIAYVVDGDTLRVVLGGDLVYVRLVGIDTPEDVRPGTPAECGSLDAADSMRHLAPEESTVLLRFDSIADHRDRYGRLLAHAFIDSRQLEVAQLRRGWAEVYRFEGQEFDGLRHFESAEARARRARVGVWRTCAGDFHSADDG